MATASATRLHSIARAIGAPLRRGFGLGDLMMKIISRIKRMCTALPLVAGLASCSSETTKPTVVEPTVQLRATPIATPEIDEDPRLLGDFIITFYYVANEDEVAAKTAATKAKKAAEAAALADSLFASMDSTPANDNEEVSTDPDLVHVYGPTCEPLAEVSRDFAAAMTLQGTGKLRDGRVLNVWGKCSCERSPCFTVVESQWGTGGGGRALQPFRTVAVDPKVIKLGTLLYVPLLEGRTMPGRAPWGGFVHDGCVIADDTGGGIDGNQLDLFVGRRAYYLGVSGKAGSHSWAKHVPVHDGSKICERKGRVVGRRSGSI